MLNARSRAAIGIGIGVALTLCVAGPASASLALDPIVVESKGWRITMPPFGVALFEDPAPANDLTIQLFKNFTGIIEDDGTMPAIILTFQQILPDGQCASRITINDESVTNSTDSAWSGFNFVLGQFSYASYNRPGTFPGDFGGDAQQDFYTAPFDQHYWTAGGGSEALHLFDGLVPIGGSFSPGTFSGSLKIDVNLAYDGSAANGFFTLKEIPVPTPEPATLCLLGLGGMVMAIRRQRQ